MYSLILSDAYIMAISSCRGGCPSPNPKVGHPFVYSKICSHGSSKQPEKEFGSYCDIQYNNVPYNGTTCTTNYNTQSEFDQCYSSFEGVVRYNCLHTSETY